MVKKMIKKSIHGYFVFSLYKNKHRKLRIPLDWEFLWKFIIIKAKMEP
jgi:hypothetical protein